MSSNTDMYGGIELSQCVTVKLQDERVITLGCHTIYLNINEHSKKEEIVKGYYIPLLLSHAVTVHRLQGSTMRRPIFYMPESSHQYCTEFYVIVTRVTSLDFLFLTNLPNNIHNVVNPLVIDMYNKMK